MDFEKAEPPASSATITKRTPARLSALQRLLVTLPVLLIRAYRFLYSRRMPPVCVYHPSCSEFAELALYEFGLFDGVSMAMTRIRSCDGGVFRGEHYPGALRLAEIGVSQPRNLRVIVESYRPRPLSSAREQRRTSR